MDVHDTRPTTIDRFPDRLSLRHDRSPRLDVGANGVTTGLTEVVLDCLTLFGEVEVAAVTSPGDLTHWLDRVGPGRRPDGTVPVVVVPDTTWTSHLAGRPARPGPGHGVVVVCGGGRGPAAGAGSAVHDVTATGEGEVPGALAEALAGQSCTVVHVRPV